MQLTWIRAVSILLISGCLITRGQGLPASATPPQAPAVAATPNGTPPSGSEDWNRLRGLVHEEEINVWASHNRHVRCLFTGATENLLFCEPRYPYQGSSEYRFDRADVDKVRLEQGERNFKRTIGVAALGGAITVAAATNTSNGGDRLLGALAGGLAGAFAGLIVAGPVALLVPGHLVYQRPHTPKKANGSAHIRTESSAQPAQEMRP